MVLSFIVTLVVGLLCVIFLGMIIPSVFNTIGIATAYPYAAPIIFSAIFAAVYFYIQKARSSNGYNAVSKDYADGGFSIPGDLKIIAKSEIGFYILVCVGAALGWLFTLVDAAVTDGVGGGLIAYGALPFVSLTVLPDTFAIYPRSAAQVGANVWMYAANAALVCAIYTAILASARKKWYDKHMKLHGKEKV